MSRFFRVSECVSLCWKLKSATEFTPWHTRRIDPKQTNRISSDSYWSPLAFVTTKARPWPKDSDWSGRITTSLKRLGGFLRWTWVSVQPQQTLTNQQTKLGPVELLGGSVAVVNKQTKTHHKFSTVHCYCRERAPCNLDPSVAAVMKPKLSIIFHVEFTTFHQLHVSLAGFRNLILSRNRKEWWWGGWVPLFPTVEPSNWVCNPVCDSPSPDTPGNLMAAPLFSSAC